MFDARLVAAAHGHVHQVEVVTDLFRARYEAVTTVGEAFANTVLGIGVAEACDGEIVGFDDEVWRVPADGVPVVAPVDLGLPFVIVATGATGATGAVPLSVPLDAGMTMPEIAVAVSSILSDAGIDDAHHVAAIRLDGHFTGVLLRSEHRQEPPYDPLPEVLAHEVRFAFDHWAGTLVGFRFPDIEDGIIIPGLHLHGVSDDRRSGGHCHEATTRAVTMSVWLDDYDVDIPHDALAAALTSVPEG